MNLERYLFGLWIVLAIVLSLRMKPEPMSCPPPPLPVPITVDGEIGIPALQARIAIQDSIISTLTSRIEQAQRNLQAP